MAEPGLEELRKAREAAHRHLARRAHSVAEIKSKLAERRFSPAVIRRTVERLAFARSHSRYLMEARPMGRRRLSWELSRKGIEKGLVEEAVEDVWAGRSEQEVAREVALRRLEAYRGLDETTVRRRLKGYLERRGFPHGDIITVLRELSSP